MKAEKKRFGPEQQESRSDGYQQEDNSRMEKKTETKAVLQISRHEISVGGQGGWKKRQRTKKKELDWQRERDDENEYGTVQCEGT